MSTQASTPHVKVFSLGGTIASTAPGRETSARGVMPTLDAEQIVDSVSSSLGEIVVEPTSFRRCASSDLTLADICELAEAIKGYFSAGGDGVVITQGTSTIEETAFALDLLLDAGKPVVVTGAMRNPTLLGFDGSANLLAAVRVAAEAAAPPGPGVVVVFNDEIHAARFVRKTHTSSTAAFRSPGVGPLGWVAEGRVRLLMKPSPLPTVVPPLGATIPAVALVRAVLGDGDRMLRAIAAAGYDGVVLEGFGAGHAPASAVATIEHLARTMPVLLASRTGSGEVLRETYGFPGSERDLLARGLLNAGYLDGPKARVLLTLGLAADYDTTQIGRVLEAVLG